MKLKYALRAGAMVLAYGIANANAASWYVGYGAEFGEMSPLYEETKDDWKYDSGVGNSFFTGIAFNRHWALEFGYSTWGFESEEKPEPEYLTVITENGVEEFLNPDYTATPGKDEVENSFSFGMRTSYPLLAGFSVEWGMGMHRWTQKQVRYSEYEYWDYEEYDFVETAEVSRKSESDVDFYYFAGAKYRILPTLEAGLEYSKYNMNLDNIDSWRLSIAYYFSEKKGGADILDPKDVYTRGLLTYNRAKIADDWADFSVIDDQGFVGDYSDKVEEDNSSIGFSALVGFNLSPHWSAEAGYINLGDATLSASVPDDTSMRDVEFYKRNVDGFTYGIAVNFSPYSRVSPYLRIGMFDWNQDVDSISDTDSDKENETIDSVGTYLGFGLSFDVTPQLSIITELDRYAYGIDADDNEDIKDYTNTLAVGAQYRFGVKERPQQVTRPRNDMKTYPANFESSTTRSPSTYTEDSRQTSEAIEARDAREERQEEEEDDTSNSNSVACDPRHKHLFFDCE